jgi:hypothetical protein
VESLTFVRQETLAADREVDEIFRMMFLSKMLNSRMSSDVSFVRFSLVLEMVFTLLRFYSDFGRKMRLLLYFKNNNHSNNECLNLKAHLKCG